MFQWLQKLFSGSDEAPAAQVSAPPPPVAAQAVPPPVPARPAPVSAAPAAGVDPYPGVSFDQRDNINSAFLNFLFERGAQSDLDTSDEENKVLESIAAILKSQQSGAAMVRRLPGLIPQLLQSLRSDNFSGAQLSRSIESDVVLLSAVIRMANTAYIGTSTRVTSVEHAVLLIGQEGLRHLITSVAFRPIIDLASGHYTGTLAPRIWDQSERTAVANRMMAESMGIEPFEAFLAGLVQNVGLIVTLRFMDQMDKDGKHLGSEMFCASLVREARTLSLNIGREWNFPDSVVKAISEQGGVRKGVAISPLGKLLAQSDYMSKVRILIENERIGRSDPALLRGLSPRALEIYNGLDAVAAEDSISPQAQATMP